MYIFEAIAAAMAWLFRGWRRESEARRNYYRGWNDAFQGREPEIKPTDPEWYENDWQQADAFTHTVGALDELELPSEPGADQFDDRHPDLDDAWEAEENEKPRPSRGPGIGW